MAKGDHIYVQGHLYDHHGIDCGNDTVIHYSGSIKDGTNRIARVSKTEFAKGKEIRTKSNYEKKYSPNEIVARAERRLNKSNTEKYNLVFNNCEHFAYDCTTGNQDSWQVVNAGTGGLSGGAVGIAMRLVTTTVTRQVAARGVLGVLGATTTVTSTAPALPLALVVGGAALAGVAIYKGLKSLDND